MGVCQGVIGVAGGASLCCTGGDCPMGWNDRNITLSIHHAPPRWVPIEFLIVMVCFPF
jgi:hypothetical protein